MQQSNHNPQYVQHRCVSLSHVQDILEKGHVRFSVASERLVFIIQGRLKASYSKVFIARLSHFQELLEKGHVRFPVGSERLVFYNSRSAEDVMQQHMHTPRYVHHRRCSME